VAIDLFVRQLSSIKTYRGCIQIADQDEEETACLVGIWLEIASRKLAHAAKEGGVPGCRLVYVCLNLYFISYIGRRRTRCPWRSRGRKVCS
jgi:hypothetical protein